MDKAKMSNTKFDELLSNLKTSKWNFMYFLFASTWFFLIPPQSLSGAYIAPSVGFQCRPPENLNVTIAEDNCSYRVNSSSEVKDYPCTSWDYDKSVFSSTATGEFDLVCSREYLRATYQSIKMFGTFVSPIIGGYFADRFGRKLVVVVTLVTFTLCSTGIAFLHNIYAILVFRFIVGFVNIPTFYTLAMEVTEMRLRSFVGILTALPWALGTAAWGGMGYFIRDWRTLQLAVSLPNFILFPLLYFMDESPRWLITKGYHEKAMKVLKKAARWNNSKLPPEDELRALMQEIEEEAKRESESPKDESSPTQRTTSSTVRKKLGCLSRPLLCSTRKITLITVFMCVDYFIVATVFYGLSLNGTNFSADPFLYMVLTGLMEIPAYSITAPVIQRFGRKKSTVFGFCVSGVSLLALAFIPEDVTWLVMTLAMVGKMMISAAYQTIYVYVNELFPTVVRVKGMGIAVVASRLGSMMSPYITDYIGPLVPWMPSVIFGGAALVAGLSTMFLPETLGKPLPDTITDLEDKKRSKERTDVEGEEEEKKRLNS
ncbi:organic cation transporter protein-like isoform X2 [Palaemon carinicauda]|uniref:organic cation transporter protein-like isoform X2 n=1 Tax=Palaemon carinicauda TaxID=392227 RepID=UPI0035B63856